jgi:hypothetical protein
MSQNRQVNLYLQDAIPIIPQFSPPLPPIQTLFRTSDYDVFIMAHERKDYLSYMVRIWRAGQARVQDRSDWRASVETPQTGEHFVFSSLTELFTFLTQEVEHADMTSLEKHQKGE